MKFISILLLLSLIGCAGGPTYKEINKTAGPVANDKARLVIYRTKESRTFFGRKAPIKLNEKKIGSVGYGGALTHDVKKGDYTYKISLWDTPGSCELSFSITETGKEYFFEVKPREASNEAFQKGSFILFPVITGLVSMANESRGRPCGGLFSIEPVTNENAKRKLSPNSKS